MEARLTRAAGASGLRLRRERFKVESAERTCQSRSHLLKALPFCSRSLILTSHVQQDVGPSDATETAMWKALSAVLALTACLTSAVLAQEGSTIPDDMRGAEDWIARGILDGNLIETNFRNHGEVARWNDNPWGNWPRGIGGRHIDGIGVLVSGLAHGEREKWTDLRPVWAAQGDTTLNPLSPFSLPSWSSAVPPSRSVG